jgi:hypothetical protein
MERNEASNVAEGLAMETDSNESELLLDDPVGELRATVMSLDNKVSQIFSILTQQGLPAAVPTPQRPTVNIDSPVSFLRPPARPETAEKPNRIPLPVFSVIVQEPAFPTPDKARVAELTRLQLFDTDNWAGVRYAETQKQYLAAPSFVELGLNDELRPYDHSSQTIHLMERTIAGLQNAMLAQKECIRDALQRVVDSVSDHTIGTALFETVVKEFGPSSALNKVSEDVTRILCGKRAELVQTRRKKILSGIRDTFTREALNKIPPSAEHIFNKDKLAVFLERGGGREKVFDQTTKVVDQVRESQPSTSSGGRKDTFRRQGYTRRIPDQVRGGLPRGPRPSNRGFPRDNRGGARGTYPRRR